MNITLAALLGASVLLSVSGARSDDVLRARDHACETLQLHAQREGHVTLNIALGTLTVHGSAAACDLETHFTTQPVWRSADERFCIVGYVCNRRFQRLND